MRKALSSSLGCLCAAILCLVLGVPRAAAFWEGGPRWPDGTVDVRLQLGSSPTYADGRTPNQVASAAVLHWNPYMARVQLAVSTAAPAEGVVGDGINGITFDDALDGQQIPADVLGLTLFYSTTDGRQEADIVVNSTVAWSSYAGPLQPTKQDLGRVVMHEVGHLLGLGHPDEHAQTRTALMNSHVSDLAVTQADDQAGIAMRYGATESSPRPVFTQQPPTALSVHEGDPLELGFVWTDVPGYPATLSWRTPSFDNLTGPTLKVSPALPRMQGAYQLTLTVPWLQVRSNEVQVTILPPRPPVFTSTFSDLVVKEGDRLYVPSSLSSYDTPTVTWFRDGVQLPSTYQSGASLAKYSATPLDEGTYFSEATNRGGSSRSGSFRVTVTRAAPPTVTLLGAPRQTFVTGAAFLPALQFDGINLTEARWYRDGVLLARPPSEETPDSRLNGTYQVELFNYNGSALSVPFTVEYVPDESLPRQPELLRQWFTPGLGAGYVSSPSWKQTRRFRWYKDETLIRELTSDTLSLSPLAEKDQGRYSCILTQGRESWRTVNVEWRLRAPDTYRMAFAHEGILYTGVQVRPGYLHRNAVFSRLDLATGNKLPDLSGLDSGAFGAMTEAGILASNEYSIYRLDAKTSTWKTLLTQARGRFASLAATKTHLYWVLSLGATKELGGMAWDTGTLLPVVEFKDTAYLRLSTPGPGRLLLEFPAGELRQCTLNGDGSFGAFSSSTGGPYYDSLVCSVPLQQGRYLCDANGSVRDLGTLRRVAELGRGLCSAVDLDNGTSLLLYNDEFRIIDSALRVVSAKRARPDIQAVFRHDGGVGCLTLAAGTGVLATEPMDFSGFVAAAPAAPVDPEPPALLVRKSFVDAQGLLWVVGGEWGDQLHAWSATTRSYVRAMRLRGAPQALAYSKWENALYLIQPEHGITRIDLGATAPVEEVLDSAYSFGSDLVPTDKGVMVGSPGSWLLMKADGTLGLKYSLSYSGRVVCLPSNGNILNLARYDSANRPQPVATLRCMTSAVDFTQARTAQVAEMTGLTYNLLACSPAEKELVSEDGLVFDVATLKFSHALPHKPVGVAWLQSGGQEKLYAASHDDTLARVERFAAGNGKAEDSFACPGRVRALHALPDNTVLLVLERARVLEYVILSDQLKELGRSAAVPPAGLVNMSIQATVGVGDEILVPGFVVEGQQPKFILVRAVGPGLEGFGVPGVLADPSMKLFDDSQVSFDQNNDWNDLTNDAQYLERSREAKAFDLPAGSKDAGLVRQVAPGLYTVETSGVDATKGRVLVELYDLEGATTVSRFVNMSARSRVSPTDITIGGFVVKGSKPRKLLLRAVGPRLADFKVSGTLPDPKLRLFKGQTVIAENDNWSSESAGTAALKAAFASTGAFPLVEGAKDAAMIVELAPGDYTVWMESADGASGVALLELYEIE